MIKKLKEKQEQRKMRVRKRLGARGRSIGRSRPRLSVFRSGRYIYAQIVDDKDGKTLVAASEAGLTVAEKKGTRTERAAAVGEQLAKKAKAAKIRAVRFDRGAYRYHGRVKSLAEAARKGGLKF